jgi:molybdenum cofactor biosynthesis protein B
MADALQPLRIAVMTISDSRTLETDRSGSYIEETLRKSGHGPMTREVVPDEQSVIVSHLRAHMAAKVDVVIATGGTGLTQRDVTPEAVAQVTTKAIPGFGELFRTLSYAEIGSSTIQSRAIAALCGPTLVFALPGSTGACKTAVEGILLDQLDSRHKPCNFATLLPRMRGESDHN